MKKNRLFVLGLVTVFVALVSLTFVSSTWAKYTTTAYGEDSARVAYWGFEEGTMEAALEIDNLFENTYDSTVNAATNVIAPGTTGSETFQLAYKAGAGTLPEVDYKYTIDVSESQIHELIENNAAITWHLTKAGGSTQDFSCVVDPLTGLVTSSAWDQLLDAIEKIDGADDDGMVYEARTLPDTALYTVSWSWAFDGVNDGYDTSLGNYPDALNIRLVIRATAEQVN